MRAQAVVQILAVAFCNPALTWASEFTFSRHIASGSGSARILDGGPGDSDSGATESFDDPEMDFGAIDLTRPGSFGADAGASGHSRVIIFDGGMGMRILVDVFAGYFPSPFTGGDRPGGTAEAQLSSLIEFELPIAQIDWAYQLLIDDTSGFSGSADVLVENVTRMETLLHLTSELEAVQSVLVGSPGDLIRVTSEMSGSGTGPAGASSFRGYDADLDMIFTIPEPTTLVLLAAGTYLITRRRSARRNKQP